LQVNHTQAEAMYARVAELALQAAPATPHVVELYAGLGGIGLHLATRGARVTTVEIDREAVAQLRRAAERAQLPITAIAADAAAAPLELRSLSADVVVVDPPRKGLGDAGVALLGELAAPIVIYVSCAPESLARDLAALASYGYTADTIEPFDLMPGTAQVETVVRLRRRPASG
jgi:tRNA/tmRNA/rRNA uracil-C5-methylase (TrmA/RlmC/RlmD family)